MARVNELKASTIGGENVFFINGFKIELTPMGVTPDLWIQCYVYRKGTNVYKADSLQDAVKWCQQ